MGRGTRTTWSLLHAAVRSNAVPAMSMLQADDRTDKRPDFSALGHAAFDFVESRSGKDGVRQFLFALRKTADSGGDPFQAGLQLDRNAFDRGFEAYLRERFSAAANQSPRSRGELDASLRVEGDVTAIRWSAAEGLACIELWVPVGDGMQRQRWAIECEAYVGRRQDALKPGDHVVVTGTARARRNGSAHPRSRASRVRPTALPGALRRGDPSAAAAPARLDSPRREAFHTSPKDQEITSWL